MWEATSGTLLAFALAGLWVVLGLVRPTTTFHLAPLFIAGVPTLLTEGLATGRLKLERGLVGLAIAGLATLALVRLNALDGPALRPFASAVQETIVLAVVGAMGGVSWSTTVNRS